MQNLSITLIVSTYNQPEYLRLVLEGISDQLDQKFSVIIADDGSTPETKSVIDAFTNQHSIQIEHIWHEDNGFRKSVILNSAISIANSDYIVFLDGDCVPRRSFISSHRKLARKRRIVGCSRVLLDQTITQHLLDNDLHIQRWSFIDFLKIRISGHLNRVLPLLTLALGPIRTITPNSWKRVRGCNFGVYRSDLIAIGGFDESFTGWGYEDSELVARAINSGCLVRRGDFAATALHLWHPVANRDDADSNRENLFATVHSGRKTAISTSIT